MFISRHRRRAARSGHGIQYVPGHVEPFVDLIVERFLPPGGEILDLGGGGLRFAFPVAAGGRRITVVDVDGAALDVPAILGRFAEVEGAGVELPRIAELIECRAADAFDFLRSCRRRFGLIAAFRVIHFLKPPEIPELFGLVRSSLQPGGTFVVSAMTDVNLNDGGGQNEVFLNSDPVVPGDRLFRRLRDDEPAREVRTAQNLGDHVHLVDSDFIAREAANAGFNVLVDGYPATRIVAGYVLRR